MALGVIVQADERRQAHADRLAATLDARVVTCPEEPRSPWRTYRHCLEQVATRHTLIIQDDAIPHPDLVAIGRRIIRRWPQELVALFHGRHPASQVSRLGIAQWKRLCYVQMRATRFVPCVAMIWPWERVQLCLKWMPAREVAADDDMIARFLTTRLNDATMNDRYLVTVPSIVEHDVSLPSLMGTTMPSRTAIVPAGPDAALLNWESDALPYL